MYIFAALLEVVHLDRCFRVWIDTRYYDWIVIKGAHPQFLGGNYL